MTLILGSIRPHDVVLTADGRSTTIDMGDVFQFDDHFQKLFPIPHHPVVIAHMGQNEFAGESIRAFLKRFIRRLNTGNSTILEIADQLRQYAHAAIRSEFEKLDKPAFGVNLWVAGFSYHAEAPRMVEVFWKRTDGVLMTEERHFDPTSVVPGGSGQDQIEKVDWNRVAEKPRRKVIAYHHTLMEQAIHAKVEHNTVGGHIHELVITPARWRWTKRPI